ncbi:hypothetical protein C8R44DRAFT_100021 [Mycena epipterygia]|nr:hypothetical protein C8R44DRAFT_100021 [Mycena epipterygia]
MSQSQSPPPRSSRRASASPSRDSGVKGITRKVIRTLEGLGHLDPAMEADDEVDDEHEVARTLVRAGKQRAPPVDMPAQKKIDWEIPRKVFHSSIGFITLGLYLTPRIAPRAVTVVLWSALAVIAPTDFVRLRSPAVERVYEQALGFLMRESERHGTNGTLWYILGVNFALTFYPIDVATVAILILSWADTAASTLGRMYGPRTPPLPRALPLPAWLDWVWIPRWALAPPPLSTPSSATSTNAHQNGHVNENGDANEKTKPRSKTNKKRTQTHTRRSLRLPFAPRKSTAGFLAACVTGALVALVFWGGVVGGGASNASGEGASGWRMRGVAEMRAVAEGAEDMGYHSRYSLAGQYLRSEGGAWARGWVPEGIIGGVGMEGAHGAEEALTTPARFGVQGWVGLVALVLCAGLVSGIAEALDVGGLDDNLTLPIISGGALMLFFRVWGWAVGAA